MSRRRVIKIVVPLVVVAIITAIAWWFLHSSNQGTISQGSAPVAAKTAAPAYKTLQGKYVSLQYKGIYTAEQMAASDNDLELYQLKADTVYTKQLNISVSQLPGGDLHNNSAYLLRASQPTVYQERHASLNGLSFDIWTKNDGTEESVFVVRGTQVASLAFVQMGSDSTKLDAEVQDVLHSFAWQ